MRILFRFAPLALATGLAAQAGFRTGDLFSYTPSTLTNGYMLLRIDPTSATSTPLLHLHTTPSSQAIDGACYEPARDRILVSAGLTGSVPELWAVDGLGNTTSLGHSGYWLNKMAPRGDGIVYCTQAPGSLTEIMVVDASNSLQPLLNATGTAAFVSPRFARMIYHPGENALYLAENAWYTGACTAGTWTGDIVNVHRVPLSPNGMAVAGPVSCTTIDISNSAQAATGWSLLPGGDLLLVIDTNSNSLEPRMQRIDPTTLAATTFASNGPYTGAATTPAGIWSNTVGAAVLIDSLNHVLRAFTANESGAGTILPPAAVTNGNATHGVLRLFEIGPQAVLANLRGTPGDISLATGGVHNLQLDTGSTTGSTYWILGSLTGWNPGIDLLGTKIWIQPDSYTSATLSTPNLGIFSSLMGPLIGGTQATGSVTVPPGLPPGLAGLQVHHCAVVFDASMQPLLASNPTVMRLVP